MPLLLIFPQTKDEPWVTAAQDEYITKIKRLTDIEIKTSKSPTASRDQSQHKKEKESQDLLAQLRDQDFVVLLEENGKSFAGSIEFSNWITGLLRVASRRTVFVIGGPYGVTDAVKKRANFQLKIAPWTISHPLARIVLLEQIYRAQSIAHNLPYHNQ